MPRASATPDTRCTATLRPTPLRHGILACHRGLPLPELANSAGLGRKAERRHGLTWTKSKPGAFLRPRPQVRSLPARIEAGSAPVRLAERPPIPDAIEGLHIHNNCESDDLSQLARSAEALTDVLRRVENPQWVNLGGGYYLAPGTDSSPLEQVSRRLRAEFGTKLFIEPGTALVQQAGFLVSEALDVFSTRASDIAVMDTSTSHIPEVFEYQYTPEVTRPAKDDGTPTMLVGRSCLAGDILGEYRFADPVRIGDRVALKNAGSYSHSRAVPFNGIPIPSVYMLRKDGAFDLATTYGYDDFAARNGAIPIAAY